MAMTRCLAHRYLRVSFLCRAGLFRDMDLEAESNAIDFYVIEVIMQDHLHHLA